jgi:glycosyltransferase involved in cell wall biosynthesis
MSPPRVLFVTYNGLLDPLGPSQILPYVEGLNQWWRMGVLSYERWHRLQNTKDVRSLEERLAAQGILWRRLLYHRRPSLPATTYDIVRGLVAMRRLVRPGITALVHARGYVPAVMASLDARRCPFLFDIRGLQAEEYVDGGVWREGGFKHRLLKLAEEWVFRGASGAVVLTRSIEPHVRSRFGDASRRVPLSVIPSCVDLDRFRLDPVARLEWRARFGFAEHDVVFIYSGSLGTWYLSDEMAQFVARFRDETRRAVRLLWLANNDLHLARTASRRAGLLEQECIVGSVETNQIASALNAGDIALALIKPCFSKNSSSPTKYAEGLACGMPLVVSRDVGDSAELERAEAAVALIDPRDPEQQRQASRSLVALRMRPREHFRRLAERLFDLRGIAIPAYRDLYQRLMER